jgi:hypothetical protein
MFTKHRWRPQPRARWILSTPSNLLPYDPSILLLPSPCVCLPAGLLPSSTSTGVSYAFTSPAVWNYFALTESDHFFVQTCPSWTGQKSRFAHLCYNFNSLDFILRMFRASRFSKTNIHTTISVPRRKSNLQQWLYKTKLSQLLWNKRFQTSLYYLTVT